MKWICINKLEYHFFTFHPDDYVYAYVSISCGDKKDFDFCGNGVWFTSDATFEQLIEYINFNIMKSNRENYTNLKLYKLSDYFMPLAEYRNQRINEILDL